MVFAQAGYGVDRDRIKTNVDWLLKARLENGWTYSALRDARGLADFSNTQYALLGLHEAIRAGVKVPEADLKSIRSLYLRGQRQDGSWSYRIGDHSPSRMTMTAAGLCGLLITGMDLEAGKQVLNRDGSAENCGVYQDQKPVADAPWLGGYGLFPAWNWTIRPKCPARSSVTRFTACMASNGPAGSAGSVFSAATTGTASAANTWSADRTRQRRLRGKAATAFRRWTSTAWPIVATSFSLLFLSKGRTPVLLTKLAYGARDSEGWNNKHNDTRHLVEFASRELFKNQPLAWQVFDARGVEAGGEERVRDLAAQMLQSPIVYFNGHDLIGWSGLDSELLKEYVANGGFVFIENCCGKTHYPAFDRRIREELGKLFETPLAPLPADHPTFLGKYVVSPRDFPLEGIQQGCKTVVVYSPVALAGYWEADDHKSERGRKAFELAANVIAYATGLEPPKPRLTNVEVFSGDSERENLRRGFIKVAQLEHGGDWHPAPKAMRNLMAEARKEGLDVLLATRDLAPSDPNLFDYRFVYMHGRKAFALTDPDKKNLHFLLEVRRVCSSPTLAAGRKLLTRRFVRMDRPSRSAEQTAPRADPAERSPVRQ